MTQADIDNGSINAPEDMLSVSNVFPLNGGGSALGIGIGGFSIPGFGFVGDPGSWAFVGNSASMTGQLGYLVQQKTYLQQINFESETGRPKPLDYNPHTNRIFIRASPTQMPLGMYVMVECYRKISPMDYPRMWMDPYLIRMTMALTKMVWAGNLSKFKGNVLGGLSYDGDSLKSEAIKELEDLENSTTDGRLGSLPGMRLG